MAYTQPTEKQIQALKRFRIPDQEIAKMSHEQARAKLSELITALQNKKTQINKSYANPQSANGERAGITQRQTTPKTEAYVSSVPLPQQIEDRLRKAIEITAKQIPDAEDRSEYLNMVTEVFRQLQSEEWLEIEKRKIR